MPIVILAEIERTPEAQKEVIAYLTDAPKLDIYEYREMDADKLAKLQNVLADIDTLKILKDYYAKYFYADTLNLDSLGNIVIKDTISRNSIIFRKITPNILFPTTTTTNTVYINRREFYGGFGIKGRSNQLNYLGGELLFRTKNEQAYSVGVGINQDFQPVLGFGMYWKFNK